MLDNQNILSGKILIVDDIMHNIVLLKEVLESHGYEVCTALTGLDAISSAINEFPDLILLDILLPDIDGLEVCKRLRLDEKTKEIPIIFISALDATTDKINGLKLGGVDYITKPFNREELLARVGTHMELKQIRAKLKEQNLNLTHINKRLQIEIEERNKTEQKLRESFFELQKSKTATLNLLEDLEREIEEHKQTENSLKISEEKYRLVTDNSADVIFTLDRELRYTFISPSIKNLRGFDIEELLNQSVFSSLSAEGIHKIKTAVEEELLIEASGKGDLNRTRTFEIELLCKNGDYIWTETKASILRDDEKKMIGFLGITRDIRERKHAQEQIRKINETYKLISEKITDVVWLMDLTGKSLYVSPSIEKFTGYSVDEYLKQTIPERFTKQSAEYGLGLLKREVELYKKYPERLAKYSNRIELEYLCKDGSTKWGELIITPFFDKNNILVGIHGVTRNIEDRKKAENTLKESEAKFRSYIENAPDGIFIVNKEGKYIDANSAGLSLLGYKHKELLNLFVWDTVDESEKERRIASFGIVKKKGKYSTEYNYLRKDGTKFYGILSSVKISEDKYLGFVRDISDRKKQEEELVKLSKAVEQNPVIVVITDINGNIEYVNPKFTEITGYKFEEVIGKNPNILKSGQTPVEEYKKMWNTIFSGKDWKGEFLNLKKDGSIYWENVNISPIINSEGVITHFIAIKEDITKQKEIETQLRLYHEKLEDIVVKRTSELRNTVSLLSATLESTDEGIIVSTNENKISKYNKKFIELFNISEDVLKKEEWLPVVEEIIEKTSNPEQGKQRVGFIMESPGVSDTFQFELKDGRIIERHTLPQVIDGVIVGRVWNYKDITERATFVKELQKAKETAETANIAKGIFLANMSHEIRSPLNAVLGFSSLLYNRLKKTELKEHVDSIKTSGQTLLNLINDILDLSKIESGKLKIHNEPVNFKALINETIQIFSIKSTEKQLNIIFEYSDKFPESLEFDELRFRQILINLIGNAVKFTDAGFIKINLKHSYLNSSSLNITLSVEDSGIGIAPESMDKIFNNFQQQEDQDTRKYGGTGLGLTITKRLVELMNGSITLKSAIHKGSTFTIQFRDVKISNVVAPGMISKNINTNQIIFKKSKVLVVDNDPMILKMFKSFFKDTDIKILTALSGSEGVVLAKKEIPDLILLDILMPEMDGFEAYDILRKYKATQNIPVVSITAASTFQRFSDDNRIKQFNGQINKPFMLEDIYFELIKYLPFEEINEKNSLTDVIDDPLISKDKLRNIPELISYLNNVVTPLWEKLNLRPSMSLAEDISKLLWQVGKKHKSDTIISMGNDINYCVMNFDIEKLRSVMKRYPALISKLKEMYENEKQGN